MNPRVLVADDDAATLAIVAAGLERLGFSVTRADDGDELLHAIAEGGPYDLMVTDISMPWMSGLHVAHSARAAGLTTPVIVMTALPIEARDVEALGPQAALLRKPFALTQLLKLARRLLHRDRG